MQPIDERGAHAATRTQQTPCPYDGRAHQAYQGILHLERLTNADFMPPSSSLCVGYEVLETTEALHWHEFYEMQFVVAGAGTHLLNGRAFPLVPGSFCLLTPADFHEIIPRPDGRLELYNVIFTDDMLVQQVQQMLFASPAEYVAQFDGAEADWMAAEFRCLWTEVGERQAGYQRIIQGTLERILITVARRRDSDAGVLGQDQHRHGHQGIRNALVYIHHNFRDHLTLERVARQAHLSPHYFSACFHRDVGRSFQAYLRDLRLSFARTLLRVSALPITEVCHASGFATLAHFDRAFKDRYGQSPRAYRGAGGESGPTAALTRT